MVLTCLKVLKRIYGTEAINQHNYLTTINSLVFAGSVFGMLTFGVFRFPVELGSETEKVLGQATSRTRLGVNLGWFVFLVRG